MATRTPAKKAGAVTPVTKAKAPRKLTSKVGNITRDWELRFSPTGTPWATTGLAVNVPKTPGDYKGEMDVNFYELVCFNSLAENVVATLTKGTRVVVSGNAEVDNWIDDEGNARETKKILCDGAGPDLRFATAVVTKSAPSSATVEGANGDSDF